MTSDTISDVLNNKSRYGFLLGDCRQILEDFPTGCIDCIITSPPYWRLREYKTSEGHEKYLIGAEETPSEYIEHLVEVFSKAKTVLKSSGSLWLNLGDKYHNKNLMGMPWRVALALQDDGWILRNDVIWDQMKGTQSTKDRLRMVHEHLFHFVKKHKYYYNRENILIKPAKTPSYSNGNFISATGVSGIKYRKQILASTHLNEVEKQEAIKALENTIEKMRNKEIVDFRMTIRGQQRTLHSNNSSVSGRAKELENRGFFIIQSYSTGYSPNDVWRIVPEDLIRDDDHYAVFPVELLEIPIKSTCPEDGILLDPFMGTGSAVIAALKFGNRGIGIDTSAEYIDIAKKRLKELQTTLNFTL